MPNKAKKRTGTLQATELALRSGETTETIRYYARSGLIQCSHNPENGYMCFTESNVPRLIFIRKVQALGLTIGDIKSILVNVDQGVVPTYPIKSLIKQRLASVRARATVLQELEEHINEAVAIWESSDCQTGAMED